jgi:hypothetical protein
VTGSTVQQLSPFALQLPVPKPACAQLGGVARQVPAAQYRVAPEHAVPLLCH